MTINPQTPMFKLLDAEPEALYDALNGLNKGPVRVRNPQLLRLLAKQIRIEEACKITGTDIADFMAVMKQLEFDSYTKTLDSAIGIYQCRTDLSSLLRA